jgi:ankyrin repeat protein
MDAPHIPEPPALYIAAKTGDLAETSRLLEHKCQVDEPYNHRTALHEATVRNHIEVVQLLLGHDADISFRSKFHDTALHVAAGRDLHQMVAVLIANRANVNALNRARQTPLHVATSFGCEQTMLQLLRAKADIEASNQFYKTPLMIGAIRRQPASIARLLLEFQANVDALDNRHESALHISARDGNTDWVKVLLEFGASKNIRNVCTTTP